MPLRHPSRWLKITSLQPRGQTEIANVGVNNIYTVRKALAVNQLLLTKDRSKEPRGPGTDSRKFQHQTAKKRARGLRREARVIAPTQREVSWKLRPTPWGAPPLPANMEKEKQTAY